MKRTWKDNIIHKYRRTIERRHYLKLPLSVPLVFVVFLYDFITFFAYNRKRFSSMIAVILFSVISSSFAFPGMQGEQTLATGNQSEWAEIQENYDYVPVELGISQNEVLDDEDVIIGYDNEELNVQDEIDQFTLDDILEANEVSRGVTEREEYGSELSIDDWQLVLVNKQHPVPEDYTFTLGTITGTMKCDVRIIDELMAMMEAAKADGIDLMICSPYRDYNRQTVLFNRKIDYYMDKGYSYLEAYKIASITVTVPGASEHQIGLALDIVSNTYTSLDTGFGKTDAGIWLREHGYEYGFILRYPLGKEYITGIQYEPWHYRYVGKKAATAIMKQGITLEEFLEDLE
ncbi:MAG: M15 family metallopeptidase [Alphaproteobacteria bacterium]|nr:M15 family metallopeptidase [Alphaproteobacteria bacterium]